MMVRFRQIASLLVAVGCAAVAPASDNAYCAQLFDQLDAIEEFPQPAPLAFDFRQQELSRIRQARCITFTRNLVGMEALGESLAPHTPPAGPVMRPVAVQAGVVTNMPDEARARAFFQSLGYRARSVGSPGLGTRIYVEARTPGAIQDIVTVAQTAGFIGPYPSRFVTF